MKLDTLLPLLDSVRPRGDGRYSARCPAHADKSPSLSVSDGAKAILVRCWAGCSLQEICKALGIREADLFFDSLESDPVRRRAAAQERERRRHARERHTQQQGTLIDALREADIFIQSRRGLDISAWNHDRLHDELNALADAYYFLEREAVHG